MDFFFNISARNGSGVRDLAHADRNLEENKSSQRDRAVELYETLSRGMGDLSITKAFITLVKDIQFQVNHDNWSQQTISLRIKQLSILFPAANNDVALAEHKELIKLLGKLAQHDSTVPSTASELSGATMTAELRELVRSVEVLSNSGQPIFEQCTLPELESSILGYLDANALRQMRLVSWAARDRAESRLTSRFIRLNKINKADGSALCAYYKNLNVPSVRIKLEVKKEDTALFIQLMKVCLRIKK
jgi:hypothetical protein